MTITEDPRGYFRLSFRYRPSLVDGVKRISGRRFDGKTKEWTIPAASKQELDRFVNYVQKFEPVSWGGNGSEVTDEDHVFELPTLKPLEGPHNLKIDPYPYQLEGIQRGLELKRFMNTDEPGLGKTMQSIATINLANAFPCLVICPASLKINWEREWNKFTDKKAMVLSDSVRDSWPFFWQTGLNQVFIVNYESLKKYFVHRLKKSARFTLRDVEFKNTINLFKSVIIDESHRCFTYDTEILTNKGLVKIGDIVEKNMTDLLVASWNFSLNAIFYNKISNVWRNEIKGRNIHRIYADGKYIECTEDHKIHVDGYGWKEAISIRSGENLFALRKGFLHSKTGKDYCSILLKKLCIFCKKQKSGNTCQNGQKQVKTKNKKGLLGMWEILHIEGAWSSKYRAKVLWKKLFREMENETTRGDKGESIGSQTREKQDIGHQSNEVSSIEKNAFRTYEEKQPNEKSGNARKDEKVKTRKYLFIERRKRTNYSTATNLVRCIEGFFEMFGISYQYEKCKRFIRICSKPLQGGYRSDKIQNSDRGGRKYAQIEKVEIPRQAQNRDIKRVRVESNTILESRNYGKLGYGSEQDKYVYDLEIENDHNYFANGILVSNCKSSATQQSKFTKGICAGKEWIIQLTGTPVVNKPKDLVAQLSILGRMDDFGGYKNFVQRYCSGPNEASNLKELNFKLWDTSMFRREKKSVLKDLPDKMRQTLISEITNRKEYHDAEDDLINYLIKYKDATDEKIQKALRGEVMVRISILRQVSAKGKLKEVIEFVNDFREQGQKIVLFCSLHEIVDGLKKAFPTAVSVTGRENQAEKQAAIDSFQNNPKTDIIICSIRAAGVGLTLTAASNVAFIEFPWTYADCVQCEDRCHRIGQKDSVTCYYFLGRKTIDEKVYQIIQDKKGIAAAITGSTEQIPENIVDLVANLFNNEKSF